MEKMDWLKGAKGGIYSPMVKAKTRWKPAPATLPAPCQPQFYPDVGQNMSTLVVDKSGGDVLRRIFRFSVTVYSVFLAYFGQYPICTGFVFSIVVV